ncbi:hypothetical protein MN0502_34530 (plasmid) [Arthrobacter sp. MN05-02]|nr:hypothetical protein MN0502_34530 [Arthrobacter sp. MN05-02]
MSSVPLVRNAQLDQLIHEGYDVVVDAGHLVVRRIPFVNEHRQVQLGFLAYPVTVTGDAIVYSSDHRIWFGGGVPCDESGTPLFIATPEDRVVSAELRASYMLSSKPASGAYTDDRAKVMAYTQIVSHPAEALDPSATSTPGAAWQEVEDHSPFNYLDTATTRAGLTTLSACFHGQTIAIVGLGGTGSYILDQVAKTPVQRIILLDGDTFENHNAFRAPGAPTLELLRERPSKAQYFADIYSHMHRGVVPVPQFVDEDTLHLLDDSTFVFIATDDADTKMSIVSYLEQRGTPFVDVGMGIEEVGGKLTGLLRVTSSLPGHSSHVQTKGRIPGPAPERDDYARNIQIADLNALNAQLAITRWKRYLGLYADLTNEGFSTYSVATNELANEDTR